MAESEDRDVDIPPAPTLTEVAQGIAATGERWTVTAGGTRSQYWTFMHIELPDGRVTGGGGIGGQILPTGRFINCSFHSTEAGLRYVVGRVDRRVKWVRLEFVANNPSPADLRPVGESAELGVAFVAEILPCSAELVSISAWDERGNCLGRQGTFHYSEMLRAGSADAISDISTIDDGDGWTPLDGWLFKILLTARVSDGLGLAVGAWRWPG